MAGICHLASGFNTGNVPETECSEMRAKRVIFWGFRLQKGGEKGVFGASKDAKRHFWACGRGHWRAQRGFRARIGHYVSANARPKSTPRDDATGEKVESPYL